MPRPRHRKRVLQRFAELIRAHREELALTETLDMGKPIADSLAVDIPSTANCIQWYAEAVDKIYDEVAPTDRDALALVTREPLGVVGAIVPWNFPLIMAAWKLGPMLAAGNSHRAEAVGEIPPERAAPGGARDRGRPARRRIQCRDRAWDTRPARRWPATWTSTASRSPAPPPPAS